MGEPAQIKSSFAPVCDQHSRLLILGSLPGDASLLQGHYYAHPRNAFWPMLAAILSEPLLTLPFAERYPILLKHGIALWDVVHSAARPGSLDSALTGIQTNTLSELLQQYPGLTHVVFNGQTAARHGQKLLPGYIHAAIAPSSSPAHTLSLSAKLAAWQPLIEKALVKD
ncbi:DNA-deoxyinosine glycosylase [Chitinibacter sp. GC72]|uniref:DNA-deoxyinosine glycosylase n=1 Tax=Chitinibacter sp. GC72 TaxID=1526917 RepID=UPI0012FCDCE7|nr:DNA-deoxyinosine glycosylase [Chitinibacter sp. GC72]